MIVDVHTHPPEFKDEVPEDQITWNDKWRPDRVVKATTCWQDYYDSQMTADKSIVFGIAWKPGSAIPGGSNPDARDTSWYSGNINDAVAAFVATKPDKLIGFMALHPYDPACLDELERARVDLKLRGIKLGANYQNFDPFDARALAIFEYAQKYQLPIMFHQGTSPVRTAPIRHSYPLLVDELARPQDDYGARWSPMAG
jgi:predicted TIM-barrel fold metal-dependent hydrolase